MKKQIKSKAKPKVKAKCEKKCFKKEELKFEDFYDKLAIKQLKELEISNATNRDLILSLLKRINILEAGEVEIFRRVDLLDTYIEMIIRKVTPVVAKKKPKNKKLAKSKKK